MKLERLLLAFAFGLGWVVLILMALTSRPIGAAPPCQRYVVDGGNNFLNSCSDPTNPCKTVQYALSRANPGDRICVADDTQFRGPSVYTGTLVVTKSVTLDGAWEASDSGGTWGFTSVQCDMANVVLDARGVGRVISITGKIAPTIQCFTITGGDANRLRGDPDGYDAGGGIYSKDAAPVIVGNTITGNYGCDSCSLTYGLGGGVYLLNAPATAVISGNLIASNLGAATILGWGGGIALRNSDAQVRFNMIQNNQGGTVGDGGGIYIVNGSPTVADNDILTNTSGTGVACNGGGVFVQSSTPVTIERNLIQANMALRSIGQAGLVSRGGGIYYNGGYAAIRDNTIHDNTAIGHGIGMGGGMYLLNLTASAIVSGNTVDGNIAGYDQEGSGGGIYVNASGLTVQNNHVVGNSATRSGDVGQGGGLFVNGGGVLIQGNTITDNDAASWLGSPAHGTGIGGGVAISDSQSIVQGNWIAQNRGTNSSGPGVGGGIYGLSSTLQIVGNHILSNTTGSADGAFGDVGYGGGLYIESSRAYLDGNTILDNRATGVTLGGRGGGVRINSCPAFTLTNNIVARNVVSTAGSGVAVVISTGRLDYNTIAENLAGDGVGVRADSSSNVTLTDNIVARQTVGISNTGSVVNAQYTLFEGNGQNYRGSVTSANEVPGPAALRDDYHLKNWSNAIDHAMPLTWVTTDLDGDPRPFGAGYDVGADETACNRYVLNTDGGDASNDCSDPAHPCRTVQRALGQAADGDAVCVADNPLQPGPSVYTGTNTVDKSIKLDGAWQASCVDPHDLTCAFVAASCNPANVVLDAQGAGGAVIDVHGNITPTVYCFTLTGGHASEGGGIGVNGANTTIASNIITNNVAASYGGGVNIDSGSAVITANAILSNSAGYGGGGIEMTNATVLLRNNRISQNQANYGGGLELDRSSATAMSNLVNYNQSDSAWMVSGAGSYKLVVVNNAVVNNEGAALRIYNYRAELVHNTIAYNGGAGVEGHFTATLVLTNNVIAYNSGAGILTGTGGSAVAGYNLFWLNGSNPITGTHAVLGDPALLADGYHLGPGSAAIDYGAATWLTTDIDGDPRSIGPAPDLGADERRMYTYLPIVLRN